MMLLMMMVMLMMAMAMMMMMMRMMMVDVWEPNWRPRLSQLQRDHSDISNGDRLQRAQHMRA
eukprot:7377644-Karenia_brevis.AAC.1